MLVALFAKDRPGAIDIRKANREAHIAHLKDGGLVVQAGPLLDEAGQMCGSLVILEVEDMEQARDWAVRDPYAVADLFETATLIPWNRVIGN